MRLLLILLKSIEHQTDQTYSMVTDSLFEKLQEY